MKNNIRQTYTIPKPLIKALADHAKIKKIKKSQIVQNALCDYLGVVIE